MGSKRIFWRKVDLRERNPRRGTADFAVDFLNYFSERLVGSDIPIPGILGQSYESFLTTKSWRARQDFDETFRFFSEKKG
jgi:hypothetical protein